jgi:ferredoxin
MSTPRSVEEQAFSRSLRVDESRCLVCREVDDDEFSMCIQVAPSSCIRLDLSTSAMLDHSTCRNLRDKRAKLK